MKEQLSILEKFLLWSSGADHRILAQKECLTERYKYSAIGTTVLLTATMASVSGGYALFTVFASLPASIVGGSFWGLTIFNLDRFFILSSKRQKSDAQATFYTATILRLIIALLLSFVVAKPLELRLFENEINRELREETIVKSEKEELSNIEEKLQQSKQERKELYNDWQQAETSANQEAEGSGGSGNPGKGNLYEEKKELANSLKQQFKQIDNEVVQQQQEINELRQTIKDVSQSSAQSAMKLGSFLDRLVVLEKLAESDSTVKSIKRLITTLFVIIEISPVLVKTLSGKGAYDMLLEQQQTHSTYQEYLRDHKEEKLQQAIILLDNHLNSIIDFEQEVEKRKEKYLKSKERIKENIHNKNLKNIRQHINRQHSQEIMRFFNFCDREIENYLNSISHEVKDYPDVAQNINRKIVDQRSGAFHGRVVSDLIENNDIIQHPINQNSRNK